MTLADPIGVALLVASVLDQMGVAYTIGGSIAASFAGEPRSSIDVDVVAALAESDVPAFVAAVEQDFYIDSHALERAVRTHGNTNLIHHATQLKVDIFVAGGTPLDAQQLARRRRVDLDAGSIFVHPPEDILLQKLRWFRRGGETSDRQWRDILAIVRTQGEGLDRTYLSEHAPTLGVSDLLTRALDAS